MKMPRKLKVFQARLGFYDSVVSAPSQAAALRAWGTHQNLFADGAAAVSTDQSAIEVALAHPEVPLRRAIGTSEPFSLEPGLPQLPEAPRRPAKTKSKIAEPEPEPVAPDSTALDAAEAALSVVKEDRLREREAFRHRRAELEKEEAAAELRWKAALSKAETRLERERAAFVRAGGRPSR